jgi:hypothetical protein
LDRSSYFILNSDFWKIYVYAPQKGSCVLNKLFESLDPTPYATAMALTHGIGATTKPIIKKAQDKRQRDFDHWSSTD